MTSMCGIILLFPPADKGAFYVNKHAYSLTRETK